MKPKSNGGRIVPLKRRENNFLSHQYFLCMAVILVLLLPVLAQANRIRELEIPSSDMYEDDSVDSLINDRMIRDPSVHPKELRCEKIVSAVKKTIKELPVSAEHILRVLDNNRFSLFCTTSQGLNRMIRDHVNPSAYYDVNSARLYATGSKVSLGLMNHEFLHADTGLRHGRGDCNATDKVASMFPLYPASFKNMAVFQQAFDKGDARVQAYQRLRERNKKGESLTKREQKMLAQNDAATQHCLRPVIQDSGPRNMYDSLLTLGYKPGMKGFTLSRDGETREVLNVKRTRQKTIVFMRQVDPVPAFFTSMQTVNDKLQSSYKHKSWLIKLIERDAFTFQHLSADAIEHFYPEVNALRQRDIKKCTMGAR